ncbi:MAG: hypothetical protein CVV27_08430 [Candidatus Melainabacteria bacterium HGW-Melainabacteria-1]|nr:MAG: hypothetical protein CVV27_08430 [Candidatus Melainabacteria bacterium HGW-Melainabacteria-1]
MPTATLQQDALELEISAKIDSHAAGYREMPLPKASLEGPVVARLQKEHTLLETLCDSLSKQLAELDRGSQYETSQLHKNFEPLLQRRQHYAEALRICKVFAELAARLDREINEVKEACVALAKQFLPNHLPLFEKGLETFQDRCDQVADQLDGLETQSHDIQALMPRYEQWLQWVERFGEILDERIEALKPGASA